MPYSPQELIRAAIEIASCSESDDLPIGAIVVGADSSIIAASRNAVLETQDPTAHAELMVLRQLGLPGRKHEARSMTLAVTLEPCPMCCWAIRTSGIGRLVFGAYNMQYGAAGSIYDLLREGRHSRFVEVQGGVLAEECQGLLDRAFAEMRDNKTW